MNGLLLIDKPKGWSSFDVIRKLRRALPSDRPAKPLKMGHAGTLDPMASGLLIVLIGSATKRQQDFMKLDKWYEAEVKLGYESTTEDAEGEITAFKPEKRPTYRDIETALQSFRGEIQQVPPRHSAIKIDGQRAYKRARNGEMIEMPPRTVTVHKITRLEYEFPYVRFAVHVSSGTYIRSLARDVGTALGTGGYLSALRRTTIGDWMITNALSPEAETKELQQAVVALENM